MAEPLILCRECRFFADAKPYLVDGKPYGRWLEGRCIHPNPIHLITMSWNTCWLARKGRAADYRVKEATP